MRRFAKRKSLAELPARSHRWRGLVDRQWRRGQLALN
jgi:hypothetical protein